jgi:hypothetical protein
MDYYQKYLKYKAKYLELKRQIEGGKIEKCGKKQKEYDTTINGCCRGKIYDIKKDCCSKRNGEKFIIYKQDTTGKCLDGFQNDENDEYYD